MLLPALVLISFLVAPTLLTMTLPPLLAAALVLSSVLVAFVVYDGESIWIEGVAMVGLYVVIAAGFWWG